MKHIKPISEMPVKAQSALQLKAQFLIDMINMGIQFSFNKYGHGTI